MFFIPPWSLYAHKISDGKLNYPNQRQSLDDKWGNPGQKVKKTHLLTALILKMLEFLAVRYILATNPAKEKSDNKSHKPSNVGIILIISLVLAVLSPQPLLNVTPGPGIESLHFPLAPWLSCNNIKGLTTFSNYYGIITEIFGALLISLVYKNNFYLHANQIKYIQFSHPLLQSLFLGWTLKFI